MNAINSKKVSMAPKSLDSYCNSIETFIHWLRNIGLTEGYYGRINKRVCGLVRVARKHHKWCEELRQKKPEEQERPDPHYTIITPDPPEENMFHMMHKMEATIRHMREEGVVKDFYLATIWKLATLVQWAASIPRVEDQEDDNLQLLLFDDVVTVYHI